MNEYLLFNPKKTVRKPTKKKTVRKPYVVDGKKLMIVSAMSILYNQSKVSLLAHFK
jgi:hypothetical protein